MRRIISLALCLSIFSMAFAQTPDPQKPQPEVSPDDIIRISTALVQQDVVVTDKNDHVITDLKLDEFKVFESGKRQDVKFMEFVSPDAGPRIEGNLKIAGQAAESDATRNLTAGELRRVFAFVVDDLTIPIADVVAVRKLLTDFVDNQMREGDLVAIVRVVGGSGLLQQFTSDKRILRRAISRITPQLSVYSAFNNLPGREKINTDLMQAAESEGARFPADAISDANSNLDSSNDGTTKGLRALATLSTASEVTNSMKVLPGRKSLVLISGGLPMFENAQDQMKIGGVQVSVSETRSYLGNTAYLLNVLTDRASRAGVVINTLDIRGLGGLTGVSHFNDEGNEATSALFGGNNSQSTGGGRLPNMAAFDNVSLDSMSGRMGLQALAEATGGVSVSNTNDFTEALNKVVARSSYYLLAYTPTEQFDSKFHKLEIKVTRPGARVYARQGYVAKAEASTPQTREDAIIKAAMSPLAKNEVEIAGRLQYRFLPENRAQVDINLLINANNLSFKEIPDGKVESTFDVVGFLINSLGKSQGGFGQTIHATLSQAEYKRAQTSGINYTGHAELPAGTYQLRVAVREESTGRLGSFSQYLEVPNLAKKRLTASSLFLYAVDPNPGSKAAPEPLIALRQLPRKQDLRYAAIIYNPKMVGDKTDLRAQVFISRGGKIVFQEPEAPVAAAVQDGQVIKLGQLGLGKAQAGRYVLTLVITDPQADKQERTIVRSIDFTLVE